MADNWREGLAPEIRDHPVVSKYATPGELAQALIAVQPLIGAEKLVLPKDEKDEAGWEQVFTKLGRPELATGYQIPEIKDLPEGFAVEGARVQAFQETAHKLGLSQKQLAGLYEYYIGTQAGLFTQFAEQDGAALSAAEKTLRAEWGTGFDAQVGLAKKTLTWALGKESAALVAEKYGNDPVMLRLLAKVGNAMSDDVLGAGMPKPGDLTPAAAQQEIDAIMNDSKHPYHIAASPAHQAAVERMTDLFKLANPETVAA